jgi:hypothetical protein
MKKGYFRYGLALVLIACLFAFPIGCGAPSDKDTGGEPGPGPEPTPDEPVASIAASVNVTVAATPINAHGSTAVTATVRDASNNPVPDGTTVTYSLASPAWGSITDSSTTSGGIATATFTASSQTGTTQISASSGSATGSADIEILQVPAAAIQFVSASPDVIALAETGGAEISELRFRVLDANNLPLEGIEVTFSMVGPNGGEYIDPLAGSSNASGLAIVRLYSGYVAGPVTVSASIDLPMTVQSTVVSIGGGVPSDNRFSVAATILNLPGLVYQGHETEVSAWLADRFGSYNILEGTTVSFGTEVGLTTDTASVTLDDSGVATVTVRTQTGAGGAHAEDVLPEPWEQALQTYVAATYGYTTTTHPRDGLVTVLVYTKGEEHFDDLNANGVYDSGTDLFLPAYDTPEDPFYDYDDDDQYNDGSTYPVGGPPYNPAEIYIDASPPNGVWDGPDGVWSANTHIFRNTKFLNTGRPGFAVALGDLPFNVPNGGFAQIRFLVCDYNFNIPIGGTTVTVTPGVGDAQVTGTLDYTYPDSSAIGWDLPSHLSLIEWVITIWSTDIGDLNPPQAGEITVDITWSPPDETEEDWSYTLFGTVD